jgi:hypothetical protein
MAFGFDPALGWISATGPALLADHQAKYIAASVGTPDVDNGPAADMLRTLAAINLELWQDAEGAYNSKHIAEAPGTNGVAEGSALELNLAPKIGPKLVATKSTVVVPMNADPGPAVNIPLGSQIRITNETTPWTITAAVVIPGGGSIDAEFEYTLTGPKLAVAGTTWTIATPVSGWASVSPNVLDAIPGRNDETDAEYRARWRAAADDDTAAAIAKLGGVQSVRLIENPTGNPDGYWNETHWVEYMVEGGDNDEIALTIHSGLSGRAKGVLSIGNTTVFVADADYVGGGIVERFTRPVSIVTYVELTITKGPEYPTDGSAEAEAARLKLYRDQVEAFYSEQIGTGDKLIPFKLESYVDSNIGIAGIEEITAKVDTITPPVNTGTLTPGDREKYTIATLDITVTNP